MRIGAQLSSLSNNLSEILLLSGQYSKSQSPAMSRRDELMAICAESVRTILNEIGDHFADLKVNHGGRQSNYSPVPWVRIFDPNHSPKATSGFYIVFLFAADGSAVYLSLNQGTSEWRSNAIRPINNDELLVSRAVLSRSELQNLDSSVFRQGLRNIDLCAEKVGVGIESKRRAKNYELANIFAYKYESWHIPRDEEIAEDIDELIFLLQELEKLRTEQSVPTPVNSNDSGLLAKNLTSKRKQGKVLDSRARKAIEVQAEDVVDQHYTTLGWRVERVGHQKLGFDFRCTKWIIELDREEELHVEVKGTTGLGFEVVLTPNEVSHVKNFKNTVLAVVSQIALNVDYSIKENGELKILDPWEIKELDLTPSQYSYRVR